MFRLLMLLPLLSRMSLLNEGGDGGDGGGKGATGGDGGDGGEASLEEQARQAIDDLKAAGQEIPSALQRAVDEFKSLRKEAADRRGENRQQQEQHAAAIKQLAKAFGIDVGDEETPDVEALTAQIAERDSRLAEATATAQRLQVELAAFKAASRNGANPDALLDSRTFVEAAHKLDPSKDSFGADLDAAIKSALEANPNLKAAPGGRGPAQGPQGDPGRRAGSLEEAVAGRLSQSA